MQQNTDKSALIILDMQLGILAMLPDPATLIGNVAKAIAKARAENIPVIYVTVGFRPGAPEVSLRNKSFAAGKERFANIDMNHFMTVHPDLAPQNGEVTVIKRRVSGFSGSDLEVVLRAFGIQHLVFTGVATSGAVLSTVREAADKDYKLTILDNCCADNDDEVHRVLTTKVFPRQADVFTVENWLKA